MRVGTWTGGSFAGESLHVISGRVQHDRYHWSINPMTSPPPPNTCTNLIIDPTFPADVDGYGREFYSWAIWSLNPDAL